MGINFHTILLAASIALLSLPAYGQSKKGFWNFEEPEVTDSHLPAWKEGWMDLHSISTDKGECHFYVLPDGTTMLVDGGDMGSKWGGKTLPDSTRTPGEWIIEYIRKFSPTGQASLDYLWITHFHADHICSGTAAQPGPRDFKIGGTLTVGLKVPIGKIVDRGYPTYDYPSEAFVKKQFGLIGSYKKMVEWQEKNFGCKPESFVIGSSTQFSLVHNPKQYRKNFTIRNIACRGFVWTGKGLDFVPMYNESKYKPSSFDENMMSGAITIQYGPFKYYNGGDLPGGTQKETSFAKRNFEPQVADVCGPVTVCKVNHHGYYDTCTAEFLTKMNAREFIVSSVGPHHPTIAALTRLTDPYIYRTPHRVFATSDHAREYLGDKFNKIRSFGHVVVRVYEGGNSYQVYVLDSSTPECTVKYQSGVISL